MFWRKSGLIQRPIVQTLKGFYQHEIAEKAIKYLAIDALIQPIGWIAYLH